MSVVILRGDAACLPLPDASVDLVVTSPPYWGLRSYSDGGEHYDGQIGSEVTPGEFIAALLDCTREWMRVLKPEGSIFVNLGDKYAGGGQGGNVGGSLDGGEYLNRTTPLARNVPHGFRPKSLMLLPQRYAIGCVDQLSLILRAEIVWQKPNGLPESVTDRVRRSHEQVFHFTRSPRYYAAVDEIREQGTGRGTITWEERKARGEPSRQGEQRVTFPNGMAPNPLGKLPGSVWEIPSQPLAVPAHLGVDHFAAFPMELPRRIILGWSPSGICTACGEGRRAVPVAVALDMGRPQARRAQQLADRAGLTEAHFAALLAVGVSDTGRGAATQSGTGKNTPEVYVLADEARSALGGYAREYLLRRPTRFAYVCACRDASAPTRPAVVLDPFSGTGTTQMVASVLGRIGIGVDRSMDYCRLAKWRTADPGERARALGVPKPPPVPDGQGSLFDASEAAG